MPTTVRRIPRLAVILFASSAVPQVAAAAEAANAAPATVEEVVVTALKQNTTALDTPATVAVMSRETLAQKNITTANQLSGVTPGLVMSVGVAGLPGVSFRGLGSNSAVFSLEPSVGQYQDGVYLGHARAYVSPLYDIDHVEFIQGTQSTLLGKNVSLGAISIVNRRPGGQFGWDANLTHSFKIDGDRFDGALNVPVSDKVSVRAAVLASRDEGYLQNSFLRRSEARQDDVSGRLMVAVRPTEALDVLVSYQHDRRRLSGQDLQAVTDPAGVVLAWSTAAGAPLSVGVDRSVTAQRAVSAKADRDPFDRQSTDRLNLIANYDLGGSTTLTWQSAYVHWWSHRATDLDFTSANLFGLDDDEKDAEFTQEVRLASAAIARTHVVAGVFYYRDSWDYARFFEGAANVAKFPLTGQVSSLSRFKTSSYSAFGSATFDVTDTLKLDGGVRYTHERKTGRFQRAGSGVLSALFPVVAQTTYTPQVTDPFDYNVGVRWQPTSRLLAYASYAKASKSGGFQDAPTTVAGAPFLPETAYSAEAGVKARLDRGYVTAAVFDTKIDDFQTSYTASVGNPPVSQTVVGNSQVRSTGAQANASYELIPHLKLDAEVVYAHSRFRQDFSTLTKAGDALTRAPTWSGHVGARYEAPVDDGLTLFAGASVEFASLTRYQFVWAQPLAPIGKVHQILDAQVGLRGKGGAWEVAVLGTNLGDDRYAVFATSISAGGGAYYGQYNRPRVIAVQLKMKR
ncbi:MAG TPA: TonB-dependent receptor [Phenylobacterium sp.]|nr:TonB-dependent receptor [Phenylobacterium sp.]